MKKLKGFTALLLTVLLCLSFSACSKADKDYGVTTDEDTAKSSENDIELPEIMSSDRVMSNYFDLSLFDEENYSEVYLGKKFEIEAKYDSTVFEVPVKMTDLVKKGWNLVEGSQYDENSLIYAKETVDAVFEDEKGAKIYALFYNSSNSSVRLSNCNIVKFRIENNYYQNPQDYNSFNINGVTNSMAITDVIEKLGTPSHFYEVSETSYYLDYFITKKDRRNGITVYINTADDSITAIEFSYYK